MIMNSGKYIEEKPIAFAWAIFFFCIGGLFFEMCVHFEGFRINDGISYTTTLKDSSIQS